MLYLTPLIDLTLALVLLPGWTQSKFAVTPSFDPMLLSKEDYSVLLFCLASRWHYYRNTRSKHVNHKEKTNYIHFFCKMIGLFRVFNHSCHMKRIVYGCTHASWTMAAYSWNSMGISWKFNVDIFFKCCTIYDWYYRPFAYFRHNVYQFLAIEQFSFHVSSHAWIIFTYEVLRHFNSITLHFTFTNSKSNYRN